ncbi:ThiS family, putative [Cyanobium sp. PCC 7001]|uniref:MoaD/ThiS family protein n=1 Tax=Cyanobium sp. PCC 7001 TaxID=180281 RepID=UPI0001805C1C|nr:MoaD/ThiS family protein [Cyanobium sp. PCC 7001]EDY38331.1 ThiS family, putative [Cyanobium sp. PCC 7001]
MRHTPAIGPFPDKASSSLQVRLFARLREEAGWGERRWPLPAAGVSTPLDIWRQLKLNGQGTLPAGVRVAINQQFAPPDQPLQPGDELAFLPPISGG